MSRALMTGDEYRSGNLHTLDVPARPAAMASVPVADNVVDGRNWGDDIWSAISGGNVVSSAESAAKVSAVFFCTSLIAVTIGSLQREIRDRDGRVVPDHELTALLDDEPNLLQTGDEFWSSMAFRAALAGRAFAEPEVDRFGGAQIWPLDPLRIAVDDHERGFMVRHTPERGPQRQLSPLDVFWISGLADANHKPLTPWKMAKGQIEFALALENQGRDFFKNGARLGGVLETDHKLTDEAEARLRDGIARWRSGKIVVLEQGLSMKEAISNNADNKLPDLITQRTMEMARYWHIPRSMVGEDAGAKTSQEQEDRQFGKYVIWPWVRKIEQAVKMRIMTPEQRRNFTFHLNMDSLLAGDSGTQWKNAVLARTGSIMSTNEIRMKWFGLPRIEGDWADDANAPLNSNRGADTMTGGETAPQSDPQRSSRAMLPGDIGQVTE